MENLIVSDCVPSSTLILGEGNYFSLDCYRTKRNNNVLVVGAAGAGKTRSVVIPNLLQATGSYVISDPKGNLYKMYGAYLKRKGYQVRLLNFDDPEHSIGYNFFKYIRSEKDILKLAHMLIYANESKSTKAYGGDPFWDEAGQLLLTSLIAYLWKYRPKEEQTVESILKLLTAGALSEYSNSKSPLDRIMDEVELKDPKSIAAQYYRRYQVGASKTKMSILITLTSHLGALDVGSVRKLLSKDETRIASIGRRKTALFVQVSDTDRSMDSLANIFFTQAMNELCYEADHNCEGYKLPIDVRFILDDFATNVTISDFPRMISSIRSRGISTMLMIQAESQLQACYGADGDTIISNCDSYLYLGTNDINTAHSVSIRANQPLDKILSIPLETGWLFRRGEKPRKIKNFDLEGHLHEWGNKSRRDRFLPNIDEDRVPFAG